MNLKDAENTILDNRGNAAIIDGIVLELTEIKRKLDYQMETFLEEKCSGVLGLRNTELDTSNPIYRYFNHKSDQYAAVTRLMRVAEAYK